jgi:methylated-DNA-[protein]-cysteine S-methyltransferase
MTSYSYFKHPLIDKLLLIASPTELTGIYFADLKHAPAIDRDWKFDPEQSLLKEAAAQMDDYFNGKRTEFSLPLHFGGTEFQRKIWKQLLTIPFGETICYEELAKRAGHPKAVRAAGSANGKNPFCIIVPCHRVIAKDGTIGGYAGGLARKRHLLAVEK